MNKKLPFSLIILGAAVVIALIVVFSSFVTIQPGFKGIVFRKFTTGLDKKNVYDAGFYVVAPWNEMYIYDVREQQREEIMDILDKSALQLKVDISIRFRPMLTRIGYLHENFGKAYVDQLIVPEVRSKVREIMGRFTVEEIYSTHRKEVEEAIKTEVAAILRSPANNIEMTAMLVRSITLPEQIQKAIESKLTQEQEALAYQFRLDKEKSEAERKKIAAEGESRANEIINKSLTPGLLKMRGIEATLELSKSSNSKVVIIGGKDGIPVILGND